MKLIGSYTSPFVRKISILLLEKGIEFEFINEQPYNAENGVAQYNPLGKVPALVTDEGEYWFDSPIIAEYIELLGVAPTMLPADPKAALAVKQIEALADGIMDAALTSVREQARPAAQQSETELLRQRGKKSAAAWTCANSLSGREDSNRQPEPGNHRYRLRHRLSQLPPGFSRLVRRPSAAGETGRHPF
ncbi:glutathione S-transferase [Enterobacter asburiae]|uniref:Glutathione S-transferase n=1 Tax=Enterobacter asburiae TaxID=61645 RepID=A0A376FI86_ENTAS|nr:glutathione S-transferase [Enterobacter asburiae]